MDDEASTGQPGTAPDPDRYPPEAIESELWRLMVSTEDYVRLLFVAVSDYYRRTGNTMPQAGRVLFLIPFSDDKLLAALQALPDGAGPTFVAEAMTALRERYELAHHESVAGYAHSATAREEKLAALTRRFVQGELAFWPYWREFMDVWCGEYKDLPQDIRDRWDQIYDLVYMGQPDPTPEDERAVGLIGEKELRRRIVQALGWSIEPV